MAQTNEWTGGEAMTLAEMFDVVKHISHPGFTFNLVDKGGSIFLQIECQQGRDSATGAPMPWKGRKWYLSPHMTRSEIVQTAFLAVLTALEHEARESFRFKGVTVLDPHLDLDNLAQIKSEREEIAA